MNALPLTFAASRDQFMRAFLFSMALRRGNHRSLHPRKPNGLQLSIWQIAPHGQCSLSISTRLHVLYAVRGKPPCQFCGSHHTTFGSATFILRSQHEVLRIIPRLQSRGTRSSRKLIARRLIVEAVKFTAQDLKRMLSSVVQSNW